VFLRQREDTEDAADAAHALMLVNVITDHADGGAGMVRGAQRGQRFRRRAGRSVGVVNAMPPARRAHVLANAPQSTSEQSTPCGSAD